MARMLVTKSAELWHLSLAYIPLVQGNPLAKANTNRVEKCPNPRRYYTIHNTLLAQFICCCVSDHPKTSWHKTTTYYFS